MLFDEENDDNLFIPSPISLLTEQVSDNLSNSYNSISDNHSPADQSWIVEQLQMQNNQSVLNKTSGEMDINDNHDGTEGGQSHSLDMNDHSSHTTSMNPSGENIESAATGDSYVNELSVRPVAFCRWYLEQLRNQLDHVAVYLPESTIPIKYEEFIQTCQHNPQTSLDPEGFRMFSSIIQHGQQILQRDSQDATTGNEPLIRVDPDFSSGPTDEKKDHTDEQLRALAQHGPPVSHSANNDSSSAPPLVLPTLLLEQLETIKGNVLVKLEFIHRPKLFWKARTINCLAKNECAPLQSTTERQFIVLKWSNLTNVNEDNLFVHVKLLGYNDETHPSKFIVPPGTVVSNITEQIVECSNEYGCNLMNKTILFPLTKVKSADQPNQIALPVFMFNSFKLKKDPNAKRASTTNDTSNTADLDLIKNEIEKICKLRIKICQLTKTRQIECVSEYIDTEFIQESKGTEELTPIDPSKITPIKPCECGNEDMSVLLNTNSEKAGFVIIIDGRQIASHEFHGITRNTIIIHPPPKKSGVDGFDLTIQKINVLKTIREKDDPLDVENLAKDTLWDGRIIYTAPNAHCDHPPRSKKAKKELNSIE